MKFLRKIKELFNGVKGLLIEKLESLGFIERSAEKWDMKPRGAIYVYLSIIALVVGVALLGYVIYLMVIWHAKLEGTWFTPTIRLIIFIIFKILISIAVFVYAVFLPGLNIFGLLNSQPSYVDYLVENDQRRFARRYQYHR
jgi:hypothetical protein